MSSAALPIRAAAVVRENAAVGGHRRLSVRVPGWRGFAAGQFVMVSPGAIGSAQRNDPLLPRPMAVYRSEAAADGATDVELLYKVAGRGTALLADARAGDRVSLVGPLGRGFALPAPGVALVLIGGGTGVASLYELAARASATRSVQVLLGARTQHDLVVARDFAALPVRLRLATEDGSRGRRGFVTDLLDDALCARPDAIVFACGPTPMMRRVAELSAGAGHACRVSLENPMACGFGVCLGCAAPLAAGGFALVCRDGPVFDASAVDWDRLA